VSHTGARRLPEYNLGDGISGTRHWNCFLQSEYVRSVLGTTQLK
jgi:hypothetical protein